MTDRLSIALAQINPTVGDIAGNLALIRAARAEAASAGADLVVCTELCVTGYPPEDLILKPAFLHDALSTVDELIADTADGGPGLLIGAPWLDDALRKANGAFNPFTSMLASDGHSAVYNAALLIDGGALCGWRGKYELCNYSVFDEKRVFKQGALPGPMNFRGVRLGAVICEDLWHPDVTECLVESGAEILITINGSHFDADKPERRIATAVRRVRETGLPLIYVNQVGGQDDIVFDGDSFVLNADCGLKAKLPTFEPALAVTGWQRGDDDLWRCTAGECVPPAEGLEGVYGALMLGLRDYIRKNGFPGVILGLSGGIDSALSAAVAVDALGPEGVHCVMMPSPYTAPESLEDAAEVARLLGLKLDEIPIMPGMQAFDRMLEPHFNGLSADITEENIQARLRGMVLMALSNKFGKMVLSTGNKSELAVGYATLYGDMCGGYNVLKDVYKTKVFQLAAWRNQVLPRGARGPAGRVIPERVITKPPSAELKPEQTDQDSLPPYEELDDILECLVERESPVADVVARGHEPETVAKVWRMLDNAEYKRRQAAPGVRVTIRDFARDRRYPITNAFKGPL